MEQLAGLPATAFDKQDRSPDTDFYLQPRLVTHIDDAAIAAVTQVYREVLQAGGDLLDLMSSWVSHLPAEVAYVSVVGHGMNERELAANPRLSRWFVQDLNAAPARGGAPPPPPGWRGGVRARRPAAPGRPAVDGDRPGALTGLHEIARRA